jgi:hypothetical protein
MSAVGRRRYKTLVKFTLKEHGGAVLVAAAIVAASLAEGAFDGTAFAAASIVLWAAVIAGLVSRALPATPVTTMAAAAGICLALIVLLAGASVAWASDQGRAFEEAVRASAYLGLFTLAACTASPAGRAQWLGGFAAGLGVVSILAVASHLQPGLIGDAELDSLIPGAAGRLSYPIGYWNGLAALLAIAAVLLVHGGGRAPERWMRAAATALVPVALLGIWLTSSRGGAAAALIGLAVLVAAAPDRPRQLLAAAIAGAGGAVVLAAASQMGSLGDGVIDAARRSDGDWMSLLLAVVVLLTGAAAWLLDGRSLRIPRPAALAAAALAATAAAVAIVAADPAERFDEFRAPPPGLEQPGSAAASEDVNSSGRWQFWGEAVDAFEGAPVAGIGAGAYEDYWAQNATLAVFVRNPHSLPLQQAAELGAVGLLLLVALGAVIALAAYRRLAAGRGGDGGVLVAVLAAAAACAVIDWTWAIPAAVAPALAAAGLLTASAPGRRLGGDAYWLGLGTVVVAWVAVVAGALVVLTELKLEQSRDAAARGEIELAIERAEEAKTVEPWSPEPYTQLALLEEARGNLDQALVRLEEAEQRDSEDWRLALIEARLQRGRGDVPAARIALARARALNPLNPIFSGQG